MMTRMEKLALAAGIRVPEWVPDTLRAEYADRALAHGEEWAASWARKRKHEIKQSSKDD